MAKFFHISSYLRLAAAAAVQAAAVFGAGLAVAQTPAACPQTYQAGGAALECVCGPGPSGGLVWGGEGNVYTNDSGLCVAAQHAGFFSPGAAAAIKVTPLPGRPSYPSSTRNGVTSIAYSQWGGSIRIEALAAPAAVPAPISPQPQAQCSNLALLLADEKTRNYSLQGQIQQLQSTCNNWENPNNAYKLRLKCWTAHMEQLIQVQVKGRITAMDGPMTEQKRADSDKAFEQVQRGLELMARQGLPNCQ